MRKITETDLAGKGNLGRPDIPGVSTTEMQRILDELSREIIVPAFNELSREVETAVNDRYTKKEVDRKLNEKAFEVGAGDMTKSVYDPGNNGVSVTVQPWSCTKAGTVYTMTGVGSVGRCKIPADLVSGDTFFVNGNVVPAYCGADTVDGDTIVAGRWVLFTFDGSRLDFNGGGGLSASKLAQATAADTDVLTGKKYYANGKTIKQGKMPNNGAVSEAIYPGDTYAIPIGYHNGNGSVTAKRSYKTVYLGQQTAYWTNFIYDVKSHYGSIYDKLSRSNFYTVPYVWSGNSGDVATSGSGALADYVSYNADTGMLVVGPQSYGKAGAFISNVLFKVYMIY